MNYAPQAIATGRGFQLIANMMQDFLKSGLNERQAVHEMLVILDTYQKQDEENALKLIKHLREWTDSYGSSVKN